MRGQRGQATIDYLAVVLVVAAVMAAVVATLMATGIGGHVVAAMRRALCVVTGGACDEAARMAAGPCVRSAEQHSERGQLSVFFVRTGDHEAVLRERRSDGTIALTLIHGDVAGIDLSSGVGAHVRWGRWSKAVGRELRAAVLAGAESGRTWILRDDADAERLIGRIRVANAFSAKRDEIPIPDPAVTFSERTGDLALDLRLGERGTAVLSGAQAYGERIDHVTGRRTVYVRNRVAGRGSVAFDRGSAAGEGEGEERYGITYDRRGRPVDFVVLSTLDVEGAAELPPGLARIAGRLGIPLGGSQHVETEQHLDLTDPGNAGLVQDFLAEAGDDQIAIVLAAKLLRERLEAAGTLGVRTYATEDASREVGGQAKVGPVGVGGAMASEDASARLVSAVTRRPDGTWGDDPACRPVA